VLKVTRAVDGSIAAMAILLSPKRVASGASAAPDLASVIESGEGDSSLEVPPPLHAARIDIANATTMCRKQGLITT
jgi:hypothetical protein